MRVKDFKGYSLAFMLIWCLLLLADIWLSISPNVKQPVSFNQSDKFYHMLMYLILSSLPFLFSKRINRAVFFALSSMSLGIFLECIQFFVPFREFSLMDMVANEVGVLLGIVFGEKIYSLIWEL